MKNAQRQIKTHNLSHLGKKIVTLLVGTMTLSSFLIPMPLGAETLTRRLGEASLKNITRTPSTNQVSAPIGTTDSANQNIAQELAKTFLSYTGCESFDDQFWNILYDLVDKNKTFPGSKDYRTALSEVLKNQGSETDIKDMVKHGAALYFYLSVKVPKLFESKTRADYLAAIKSFELGNRTTFELEKMQTFVAREIYEIKTTAKRLGLKCEHPELAVNDEDISNYREEVPFFEVLKASMPNLAIYGARKTMSVAYQSCKAATYSTDLVTVDTDVQGVSEEEQGDGTIIRNISNPALVAKTHPYLKDSLRPSKHPECFDVRKKPLIYNYGNKPKVYNDRKSELNFFERSLTDRNALGTDCSGFVFTSLASAGLKLRSKTRLTPYDVYGLSSSMLIDPPKNGLDCLVPVHFSRNSSIESGDIFAGSGHTVMVDEVGADPFGIKKIKSDSDCNSSNITFKKFDFTVIQSSPLRGGIGIDRTPGGWYFSVAGPMGNSVLRAAISACHARFSKTPKPVGISGFGISRHSFTPKCMDTPATLTREKCLADCFN